MVCYLFPPLRSSGTARSTGFAENLPRFGWHPTVLTVRNAKDPWASTGEPAPPGIDVVRTAEWNLDRLVEAANGALNHLLTPLGVDLQQNYFRQLVIPDTHVAWFSTSRGVRLARTHDVVYATCSPFSSALSGCLIKFFTGKPLVLDFRDAWSLNPYDHSVWPRRVAVRLLERLAISYADRLVVNTPGAERLYKETYPGLSKKIVSIPNGFDPQPLPSPRRGSTETFKIVHVGSFYGSRLPDNLLITLAELADDRVEFVQVGNSVPAFGRFRDRVNIRVINTVPRDQALRLMCDASLLYLRQGEEPGVKTHIAVGAKTYEYLATGIPILAECPDGDNADLVRRYASHSYVIRPGDLAGLVSALRDAISRRDVVTARNDDFLETFDRTRLTALLARLFDEVCEGRRDKTSLRTAHSGSMF
jgi:glycosyltransferase involved in cell wall biosynthesis